MKPHHHAYQLVQCYSACITGNQSFSYLSIKCLSRMFLSVYGRHELLGLFQKIQTHFLLIDGGSLGLLPDLGKNAKLPINLYFLNKHILCCAQRSYLASTSFFIKAIKKLHFIKKIISNLIEKINYYPEKEQFKGITDSPVLPSN